MSKSAQFTSNPPTFQLSSEPTQIRPVKFQSQFAVCDRHGIRHRSSVSSFHTWHGSGQSFDPPHEALWYEDFSTGTRTLSQIKRWSSQVWDCYYKDKMVIKTVLSYGNPYTGKMADFLLRQAFYWHVYLVSRAWKSNCILQYSVGDTYLFMP